MLGLIVCAKHDPSSLGGVVFPKAAIEVLSSKNRQTDAVPQESLILSVEAMLVHDIYVHNLCDFVGIIAHRGKYLMLMALVIMCDNFCILFISSLDSKEVIKKCISQFSRGFK